MVPRNIRSARIHLYDDAGLRPRPGVLAGDAAGGAARRGRGVHAGLGAALGEFGPILVFSGATRFRTGVLSTTVFLELSVGDLQGAPAVSLVMVAAAVIVLVLVRLYRGEKGPT